MNRITPQMMYYQPANIEPNLHIWQDENSGTAALVQAARDMVNGQKVKFALCTRESTFPPTIAEIIILAMGDGCNSEGHSPTAPRYCDENGDPNGAGSSALIASWYEYAADPASIAVAMARAFACIAPHYFRLR